MMGDPTTLTEAEAETVRRMHVHISALDLLAAVERIKADAYAAGLAAASGDADLYAPCGDKETALDELSGHAFNVWARTDDDTSDGEVIAAFRREFAPWIDRIAKGAASGDDLRDRVAALTEHQTSVTIMGGWSRRNGKGSDRRYGWSCSCGEHSPDGFKVDLTYPEADVGRFAHVAAVLAASSAPVVSRPEAEVKAEALREAADLANRHRTDILIGNPNSRAVGPLFKLEQSLLARAASLPADPTSP